MTDRDESGAVADSDGPVVAANTPWLEAVDRRYGFTPKQLARVLGCEGDQVVKVEFDSGLFYVTTREKTR